MKKAVCLLVLAATVLQVNAQSVPEKLSTAFAGFEQDPQLKSSIASLYVIDAVSGNVVFEKNAGIGLAPASTQKIITAATAYELLGRDFRYETKFGYFGKLKDGRLDGGLYFKPSGDPTLGSWRWKATTETAVMDRLFAAFQKTGIKTFGNSFYDERGWESEAIPGGWIWDDVGNYYGAGAGALNWRENQYDLILKSGPTVNDGVTVVESKPRLYDIAFDCRVTGAPKGTGDNSYIYLPVGGNVATVRGTIPVQQERFVIAGAMPSAPLQFFSTLHDTLAKNGYAYQMVTMHADKSSKMTIPSAITFFHTEQSPALDSIVYWFLKKSINLYGEALAKTMALKKGKTASAENGADLIRDYWKDKGIGIDATELNLQDGSGLSPQNRVTTHAQVAVLQYAQKQPWFEGYYYAFPEYNGMKLKSGTIGGAKSFCGYHTGRDGKKYILSFIVNNYNGAASALVQKMYKVLNCLN
ncbi:D-alanyl-D-alanine carboxypeptidase/D-alanyl-D-alanine endopeptidase [Flavisolibacter nicotianae]|uniref:D-alanyl-D-alanine carboxypeptidase/D-alanyl-D-alanine endopeptidase n=1 Tax=Flavisolibacter nicotianae TaxID=2364882 RepID=UPI0013C43122|nr:D-alanyl-D-alanine carboxypeptidase/D-alanyl-D-alanine-endopeptidase [Flavisolibacter nicotianae]